MKLKITPEMRAKWKRINARRAKSDKPPLNFPLWVKTRNRIDAIPESYEQTVFKRRSTRSPCGTVACLAGEAIICSAPDVMTGIKLIRIGSASDKAAELLGLDDEETDIFRASGYGWAKPFAARFEAAETQNEEARVAVAYLTSVIRTGRVIDDD